ncbi:hypothetical protein OE749_08085 [Aestuariibacter sp. AA17]|uniref:Uncharacterized protein n=1 Tax=Fluctibacter corallii TaxID=2984329 RepID=A0ABT3A7J5_9ALTE|nr:hypothetical protein [Aestuariibacter sp. AA17]MCV2884652.1 hypothetical protein [Aestuariibacter sp. AA17]
MQFILRTMAFSFAALFTFNSQAGVIDYLKVDGNTVYFSSSTAKASTSPACVAPENSDYWTTSLTSESGRAMYSLLVTALAKETQFDVISANDCADADGFERAQSINLLLGEVSSNKGDGIGVYQADGVTRVGTLLYVDQETSDWYYADNIASDKPKRISRSGIYEVAIFYSGLNCTGSAYTSASQSRVKSTSEPWVYSRSGSKGNYSYRSVSNGSCLSYNQAYSGSFYRLTKTSNGVCGQGVCLLKVDTH